MKNFFFLLFLSLSFADICTFTKSVSVPFDNVLDCLYSVPLDATIFNTTMNTVERAGQLYVFKDIAKQSSAPIFSATNVNLEKELAQIRATPFASEYLFNKALTGLFSKFHDGHFVYVPPTCYTWFSAQQPFVLTSYFDESSQSEKIYVADILSGASAAYSSLFGVKNLEDCVGGTIRTINNVPAVKAVLQYSNSSVGNSHDINIRYNMALTQFLSAGSYYPGEFYYRSVLSKSPEKGETVNYVIDLPNGATKNLSLRWISTPRTTTTSLSSLTASCRSAKSEVKKTDEDNFVFKGVAFRNAPLMQTSPLAKSERASRGTTIETIIEDENVSFYKIDDKTVVLVIPEFYPPSSVRFARLLTQGFQEMQKRKLTRLIIDISNNGGGIVCWGYTLAHLLMNEYNPFGRADMPVVPLSRAYATAAIEKNVHGTFWSPDTWYQLDKNETLPFTLDWFVPGIKHTRGGVEGRYSALFRDTCDILYKVMHLPEGLSFKPSQIKILTNGYCFSTCAFFSRHLQESYNVATFAVGGINYIPMGIATSPGNQVLDVDTTIAQAKKLGEHNNPLSPPGFPNSAQMTYTLREVYPWTPTARDIPLDYYFQPATHHLPYTKESSTNPRKVWEQVLEFFD